MKKARYIRYSGRYDKTTEPAARDQSTARGIEEHSYPGREARFANGGAGPANIGGTRGGDHMGANPEDQRPINSGGSPSSRKGETMTPEDRQKLEARASEHRARAQELWQEGRYGMAAAIDSEADHLRYLCERL